MNKFNLVLGIFFVVQGAVAQQAANDPSGSQLQSGNYIVCESSNSSLAAAVGRLNSNLATQAWVLVVNPASFGGVSSTQAKISPPFKSVSAPSLLQTSLGEVTVCVTVTK